MCLFCLCFFVVAREAFAVIIFVFGTSVDVHAARVDGQGVHRFVYRSFSFLCVCHCVFVLQCVACLRAGGCCRCVVFVFVASVARSACFFFCVTKMRTASKTSTTSLSRFKFVSTCFVSLDLSQLDDIVCENLQSSTGLSDITTRWCKGR